MQLKRDRLHQIHHWLQANYPTPFPTILRIKELPNPRQFAGENYYSSTRLIIRIHKHLPVWLSIDTLLHEYAHCMTHRHDRLERKRMEEGGHDPEWGIAYARLLTDFTYKTGEEDSRNY